MPDKSTPPREISPWALAGLGVQFAVALVGFLYLGQWIDRRFDTAPIFLMIGVFFGAGGLFFVSYRRLTAPHRDPATSSPPSDSAPPRP